MDLDHFHFYHHLVTSPFYLLYIHYTCLCPLPRDLIVTTSRAGFFFVIINRFRSVVVYRDVSGLLKYDIMDKTTTTISYRYTRTYPFTPS